MRLTKIFSSTFLSTLVLAAFSSLAQAQEATSRSTDTFPRAARVTDRSETKPHVGLILGLADAEGRSALRGDFGLDIGYQPYIPFGVGLELAGTRVEDVAQTRLLLRGTYNFGGDLPVIRNSYIGAGIGPILGTVGDPNRIILGFAPVVGFDIGVWDISAARRDTLSLGLQARYLMTEGSDPDTGSINGTVKYWF